VIPIPSALLFLAIAQRPAPTVLDQRFLPDFGVVTISAEGSRLDVRMEKDGSKAEQGFEIPEGRIVEARCGPWLGEQMVIALAVQQGETTSYPYVLSALGKTREWTQDASLLPHFVDPERHWFLTNPLFTSTGTPFRIVSVNDHNHGSDSFEITFRRGWIKHIEDTRRSRRRSCSTRAADTSPTLCRTAEPSSTSRRARRADRRT
jgi:hypothetical protein